MKNNRIKALLASMALIITLLLIGQSNMVSASDVKGTITVDYQVTLDEGKKICPSGVSFVVYQVGYFHNGKAVLNEKFKPSEVSLDDLTASARNQQAKELYAYASQNALAGMTVETKDGRLEFKDLDLGIYLVAQTKEFNYEEKGWCESEPFLLSIPLEINEEWNYHVCAEPKAVWKPNSEPDEPTPTKPDSNPPIPKTGDDTQLLVLSLTVFVSASALALLKKENFRN